jgi:dTMP kinase|tara:strand:- start:12866 stop:13462 length:597 start_codon:yes stop_codon:yes gene_type:complete
MKLITFEGIEGVGKSTQIQMLNDHIIQQGKTSSIIREPGSTAFGEEVRNLLLNTDFNISSEAELLLMFASRAELVKTSLLNPQTDFILCDRFYDASIAYQGYGRGLSLDFIDSLINNINCPTPDLTFLLDLDPLEGFNRKSEDKMDRIESAGIDFFTRVRNGYLQQASTNTSRIKVIDASNDISSISDQILSYFNNIR